MAGGGVVDDTAERLVRIETKLDTALTRQDDHEARVRRMEFGTVAAIVIALTALGTRITDIVSITGK